MGRRRTEGDGRSLAGCEAGDIVRVLIDGEGHLVRLAWFCRDEWFARVVDIDGDRVLDRSEPFVLGSSVGFVERVCDRTWYAARNARRTSPATAVIDPLRRVA